MSSCSNRPNAAKVQRMFNNAPGKLMLVALRSPWKIKDVIANMACNNMGNWKLYVCGQRKRRYFIREHCCSWGDSQENADSVIHVSNTYASNTAVLFRHNLNELCMTVKLWKIKRNGQSLLVFRFPFRHASFRPGLIIMTNSASFE
jgi:hypothetical protein